MAAHACPLNVLIMMPTLAPQAYVCAQMSAEQSSGNEPLQQVNVSASRYRPNEHGCNAWKVIKSLVCMYLSTYEVV